MYGRLIGVNRLSIEKRTKYVDRYDEAPGIFKLMNPITGSINAVNQLSNYFDIYILSTAPWNNPGAWSDKVRWIKRHFGNDGVFCKRMILTHRKDLNYGDILIDDRTKNGADGFRGELIIFGSKEFPDWDIISKYLITQHLV